MEFVFCRFIFNKVLHETHVHNKKKTAVRSRTVELVTMSSTERAEYFDRKQRDQLERLERVKAASSNIQSAMQLFQEVSCLCLLVDYLSWKLFQYIVQ